MNTKMYRAIDKRDGKVSLFAVNANGVAVCFDGTRKDWEENITSALIGAGYCGAKREKDMLNPELLWEADVEV